MLVDASVGQRRRFSAERNMMNSGAWMGGYGEIWMPILLVIVVVALVVWVVKQKK